MLTRELLQANTALTGLTDEQITAIVTLSQNDENSVIAKKTGEIYGALDADILAASGYVKNGTEKTYDYAKRVLGEMKTKADSVSGLNEQITALNNEKARLEKVISDGKGNEETQKALQQAKADLASVTAQYADLNTRFEQQKGQHEKEIFGVRMDNAIQLASSGLKFKSGLPESVTKVILQQVTEKIKAMNPEYIDDGKGGKVIAFKDESGAIMRNPNNQLNPFTPSELLEKELNGMGVLEAKRQASGGGTNKPTGNVGDTSINVTGARTRTEAYDIIANGLMAQGLTVGSEKFDKAMSQAWKDNNIAALPER